MTRRKTKIAVPKEVTVSFNPLKGYNDTVSPDAGGYAYARSMYNLVVSDGTLSPGECFNVITDYNVPYGFAFKRIYLFKGIKADGSEDNRLIFCTDDGILYECPLGGGTFTKITSVSFTSPPVGLMYNYNGKNVMIFSKSGGGIYIYDGSTMQTVPEAPEITSMCLHYERLFVTTGGNDKSLWFSDDFDPANWNVSLNEAGFIDMNDMKGELIKVVSFGDYLYAFKKFGITRISAYSDQRQFAATDLFVSSGKIFKDSIIVCGDCMLFAATDGIYRFDGVSTQRISDSFRKKIDFTYEYFKGQYFNGNAYIRVKAKGDSGYDVQILRLNPKTAEATFIHDLVLGDFMVLDCENNYRLYGVTASVGKLCEVTTENSLIAGLKPFQVWENGESDFGIHKEKTLTSFGVYTNKDITVSIFADGVKKQFAVKGGVKPAVLKPYMRGTKFKIRFDGRADGVVIAAPKLTLEYYE